MSIHTTKLPNGMELKTWTYVIEGEDGGEVPCWSLSGEGTEGMEHLASELAEHLQRRADMGLAVDESMSTLHDALLAACKGGE